MDKKVKKEDVGASPDGEEEKKDDKKKEKKEKEKTPMVPVSKLYSVLNPANKFLINFALFVAFVCGGITPLQALVQGDLIVVFVSANSGKDDGETVEEKMKDILLTLFGIAMGIFTSAAIYYSIVQIISHRITLLLRGKYLRALIKQEVGYFEQNNVE